MIKSEISVRAGKNLESCLALRDLLSVSFVPKKSVFVDHRSAVHVHQMTVLTG